MSLHPQKLAEIPPDTMRVAQSAFPKGNIYLKMRDKLGVFYSDKDFTSLFSQKGQPAFAPWRLALITIMQYVEGLTDRQAADAVRGRLDWKYALSLELIDSGFDFSLLSEFRTRLIEAGLEQHLFEQMLSILWKKGLLKSPQKQRTDSTHILAAIRFLGRLENIGETLRSALNSIAAVAPNWLRKIVPDDQWYSRYGQRFQESRFPTSKKERSELAVLMGIDGNYLLDAIWLDSELEWLRQLESVEILRQVWIQQFYIDNGLIKLREPSWKPRFNRYQQAVIHVAFQKSDCQSCPTVSNCTKAKGGFRTLTLRPQQFHETLEKARVRQTTPKFKKQYAKRAGVEGTISQGTRAFGLRHCRYRGFPKTRLQHIVTACALNLVRIWEWWTDAYTFGTTPSRFAALAP